MGFFPVALATATLAVASVFEFSPKGDSDRSAEVQAALNEVQKTGGELHFAHGDYHFYSPVKMDFYVSNHDNENPHRVFVPITNATDVALVGEGAEFILHGEGIAVALVDTRRVTVKGIGVDWAAPYYTETRVVRLDGDRPVIRPALPEFKLLVDGKGLLRSDSEGFVRTPRLAAIFAADDRRFLQFFWFPGQVTDLKDGTYRFENRWKEPLSEPKNGSLRRPMAVGDLVLLRDPHRPNPAVFLYRAHDSLLEDVAVHSSAGMGVIAQRSENVTCRGSGKPLDYRAGSFARKGSGRFTSSQADATHFSNCRGQIVVENCLFEGMCDDAINVHSTCLRIEKVYARDHLLCKYMHKQAVGFEVFLPGEKLRAIRSRTLENAPTTVQVSAVEMKAVDLVELKLSDPLPDGFGVGDAVENADWQPSVDFRNNIVRLSVPRATLFTTPGKVTCEGNLFESISGQAVHISADAFDWYESGSCQDVTIRNNVFRDVHRNSGKGVIQINPNVKDLPGQNVRYHRNIVIENNLFEQKRGPLLFARSVENLIWRQNQVHGNNSFDIEYCEGVQIQD